MLYPLLLQIALVVALYLAARELIPYAGPYLAEQFLPEHAAWVRRYIGLISTVFEIVILFGGLLWVTRGETNYRPGDRPLMQARMLLTFKRKKGAIRYLESVPHDHPQYNDVQDLLYKLRQEV